MSLALLLPFFVYRTVLKQNDSKRNESKKPNVRNESKCKGTKITPNESNQTKPNHATTHQTKPNPNQSLYSSPSNCTQTEPNQAKPNQNGSPSSKPKPKPKQKKGKPNQTKIKPKSHQTAVFQVQRSRPCGGGAVVLPPPAAKDRRAERPKHSAELREG